MKRFIFLLFALPLFASPAAVAQQADVEGAWQGTLNVQGTELRLVLHLERDSSGAWAATMDSPDQGVTGIPVGDIEVNGDSVRVEVPAIRGVYEGKQSGDAMDGVWKQGMGEWPLELERVAADEAAQVRRPQEPKPPFPYQAIEVTFPGGGDEVTLAGTLTLPDGEGPHPAVILLSGSGPQDRNETILGHKPFLLLADYLTRRGIAVLRYDDRGFGASTGNFATATLPDFAADAKAAIQFLQTREEINAEGIGLLGHSEGGYIAPFVAVESGAVDFLVLLAGPAVSGAEVLARQNALLFEGLGMSREGAEAYEEAMLKALRRITEVPLDEPIPDSLRATLRASFEAAAETMSPADRAVYGPTESKAFAHVLDRLIAQLTSPGLRSFLAYEPQPVLEQIEIPILALFGEKDIQVPPEQSADAMREALSDNPDAAVRVFPDLNHLFQPAETGLPSEYATIEMTIAPEVLEFIAEWVQRQV